MNLSNFSKMPFSFHGGWDMVITIHPSIVKTFFLLVIPFSLVPPSVLLYVGHGNVSLFSMSVIDSQWKEVAIIFFFAELLTVPLMGWLIKHIAITHQIAVNYKDAFLLAGITAVPMWISSVGLVASDVWTMMGIGFAGLLLAAGLLYHGAYAILKMEDPFEAQSICYQVLAVGAITWLILCAYIALPLMVQ